MLKWLLRAALAIEVLLYICAARFFLHGGMNGWTVAAPIILVAMLWRLSHGLVSFLVTSAMRWRDGRSLPLGNSLTALGSELRARVISYNWSQAFDGLAMHGDPVGPPGGTPVLLVHGYFSSRGMWVRFRQRLVAAGIGPVYAITLDSLWGSIDTMASQLGARIEAICRETGRSELFVVAHSMGGLVTRAYMAREGEARVARFITLASPHHGTRLAAFGAGECATQMRVGSEWLTMLADMEEANPPQVKTLSIYTLADDLVYPPESSALSWAENVPVSAVGHVAILFSATIADRVIKALKTPILSDAAENTKAG